MKIGFDSCRSCGAWVWRGDGDDRCASCLMRIYGEANKHQRRRRRFFGLCVSSLCVSMLVWLLSGKNLTGGGWALILCLVTLMVGHVVYDEYTRSLETPAKGGDGGARGNAEAQTAQAEEDVVPEEKKREGEDIAEIKREHKAELAAVKAESKKSLADMQREMKKLQSEKGKVDKELSSVRQTLEYYSSRARLDVYADEEALRECGGIYVIKNTGDGKVKVGLTDENFKRRFGEIQSSCASAGIAKDDVQPVILAPLDEGKYEVEQAIHDALADNKTAGEWFKVTPEEAVATVLRHVYDMRVNNRKRRTKLPVGEVGGE